MRRVGRLEHAHRPMAVPNVYSEVYYRTHLCQSFQIPTNWMSVKDGTVERVTTPLTTQEFITRYEETNTPVVLAGACKSWKASQKWNNNDGYLHSVSGKNRSFRATSGAAPLPANFTMQAYEQYCQSTLLEEAPLYLFDRTALTSDDSSVLKNDYYPELQSSCPFWDPTAENNHHDLFQYLGEQQRPDYTWLICGPQRSGSSFHIDPNATHAWNACISGRKRWIFYPTGAPPPGVFPSSDGDSVAMPISIGEWLLNYYQQEHVPNLTKYTSTTTRPLECTVEPGDVIFVPHGWWHAVVNLDEGMNIAITHNYVSKSNLATVLRFLEYKQDQISGCRDREESIKPEFLKKAFEKALKENGMEEMLIKAQEVASQGWSCRAWTDDVDEQEKQQVHHPSTNMNRKRQREPSHHQHQHQQESTSIMAKAKKSKEAFSFSFL